MVRPLPAAQKTKPQVCRRIVGFGISEVARESTEPIRQKMLAVGSRASRADELEGEAVGKAERMDLERVVA